MNACPPAPFSAPQPTEFPSTPPRSPLGPKQGAWLIDAADPATWSICPLRYSRHATQRAAERGLPTPPRLPENCRLADLDKSEARIEAVVFKVPAVEGAAHPPYFAVVSADGCVVTLFRKGAEWSEWSASKQVRRTLASRIA